VFSAGTLDCDGMEIAFFKGEIKGGELSSNEQRVDIVFVLRMMGVCVFI
jgi:hypothetical protein